MNQFIRSVARFISGKLLPRFAYPVLAGPLRGTRFILGSLAGEGGGASVYLNGVETRQTGVLLNTLHVRNVFFDIGANVGYYSCLASRIVGPQGAVIAVEPEIRNLSYLYRHIRINKVRNVRIISAACAQTISVSRWSRDRNYAQGHLIEQDGKDLAADHIVPTLTVDSITAQSGLTPDVIKIDVEGAEFQVLKGAQQTILTANPAILLSVHSESLRSACSDYLNEMGYMLESIDSDELLALKRK